MLPWARGLQRARRGEGLDIGLAILNGIEPEDHYAGCVGSGVYGPAQGIAELRDQPYRISDALKKSVDTYVDSKIAYLKSNVFPILGARA